MTRSVPNKTAKRDKLSASMKRFMSRDDNLAKFWIDPVRLQSSGGFSRNEITKIQKIVIENQQLLLEAWNAYFND